MTDVLDCVCRISGEQQGLRAKQHAAQARLNALLWQHNAYLQRQSRTGEHHAATLALMEAGIAGARRYAEAITLAAMVAAAAMEEDRWA